MSTHEPARGGQIAAILDRVLAIVESGPQDLVWQRRYRDEDELIGDLTAHAARVRGEDLSAASELSYLFAPTGPLCEIAASSGWLEEYTPCSETDWIHCCAAENQHRIAHSDRAANGVRRWTREQVRVNRFSAPSTPGHASRRRRARPHRRPGMPGPGPIPRAGG
ncbi:hypothetical protein NONO_c37220 [Nocardia nova SH22a]|uniref:Uncharacterized protein n=1 Tax=Nocardia nova SH22a TaxID=1415166 RepID=W5TH79_9NOCA|nr:hypothetical protein NONO_c37220 [Nocardia nova SH22a]